MAEGGLSEQRFEERGESSYGESVLGRKTSLCKGPEARKSLEFLGTMEEAVVAGVEGEGTWGQGGDGATVQDFE